MQKETAEDSEFDEILEEETGNKEKDKEGLASALADAIVFIAIHLDKFNEERVATKIVEGYEDPEVLVGILENLPETLNLLNDSLALRV